MFLESYIVPTFNLVWKPRYYHYGDGYFYSSHGTGYTGFFIFIDGTYQKQKDYDVNLIWNF